MHEIKKIHPQSLAKYSSLIAAVITFIFGLLNLFISFSGIMQISIKAPWQEQIISWLVSVVFSYLVFWAIGYLFAIIYNYIAHRTKGVIVEFKSLDLFSLNKDKKSDLKNKTETQKAKDKDNFVV